MEDKTIECSNCGKIKLCEFTRDPFAMEIGGWSEEEWWCIECYGDRMDAV